VFKLLYLFSWAGHIRLDSAFSFLYLPDATCDYGRPYCYVCLSKGRSCVDPPLQECPSIYVSVSLYFYFYSWVLEEGV